MRRILFAPFRAVAWLLGVIFKPIGRLLAFVGQILAWQHRNIMVVVLLAMVGVLAFSRSMIIVIPAGYGGVVWKRFFDGTVEQPALTEGIHVIWPWDHIFVYDLRYKAETRTYEAMGKDGLHFEVEVSFRFRPKAETLGTLHRYVGPDFLEVVVVPEVGAQTRLALAAHRSDAIYSESRGAIQEQMHTALMAGVGLSVGDSRERLSLVDLQDVLIREVRLPHKVRDAIEAKTRELHKAEEYVFRIQREQMEAQRRRIEASGLRTFMTVLQGQDYTDYLRFAGLHATMALVNSPSTKVLVVNQPQNTPVIIDTSTKPLSGIDWAAHAAPEAETTFHNDSDEDATHPHRTRTEQLPPEDLPFWMAPVKWLVRPPANDAEIPAHNEERPAGSAVSVDARRTGVSTAGAPPSQER